ncbi:MAG: PAS domain S-box protein [Pedobacter sp.]|uniref:PAS domain S-box protein n=1 Tax=Pedobacter sp. TaxID=1411316 RepID=UPI002806FA44|nr:PAS domain S-box protein [Pedobacter sp.]MDQ8005401.1 PAS domain S-box protein [Pedobacter sp.]
MPTYSEKDPLAFLRGSEHIAQLILSQNWEGTEVGHPSSWPLRLKYAISAQLVNPCPSFVCWGKQRIFIYNAAFATLFPDLDIKQGSEDAGFLAFGLHWGKVSAAIENAYQNKGTIVKGVRIGTHGRLGQRYLDISMGTLFELDGEIFGAWGICQEKTYELVAGDILRASQQHMRSMIGNAPIGICVIGGHPLQVEEINDECFRLLGFSNRNGNILPTLNDLLGDLSTFMDEGIPQYLREISQEQLVDGRKQLRYIDLMVSPFQNRTGHTSGLTVLVIDVTDRVEANQSLYQVNEEIAAANEELAASNEELTATNEDLDLARRNLATSLERLGEKEQQIRQMVSNAPFPIALYVGREMRVVEANQALIDVWGKGPDVIGKTYSEVLPELESQSVYDQLTGVFDTGIPFHARNQRIDLVMYGELKTFYFNYSFTPLHDLDGNVYGVMNTAADVTDLFVAKQKVEQGEKNIKNMISQAPVAMCLLEGPEYHIKLANEAMLDIWGRSAAETIGLPVFEALPDAKAQGLEEAMDQVYLSGKSFNASEQPVLLMRHGKPEVVYQNFVYQPYRDGEGKVIGILAISVNVTEMVISRRQVEETYSRLNLAASAANLGLFDMDVKSGKLEWDERCKFFFGIDADQDIEYERDFVKGLHPEDVEHTILAVEKAMEPSSDGTFVQEYRTVAHNNGQVRWIRAVGKVYFDEQRQPSRFVGVVSDISDAKSAEQQARESAERKSQLAAIVESSDDVIISKDLNGVIASWNPSAQRMFGYTSEEAIGKHISIIIPEDRLNEETLIISRIRAGQKVDHFDTVRQAKDGSPRHLSITVSPITDGSGNVVGASKIARDISLQLAAKVATAKYTERVEAINLVINAISREVVADNMLVSVIQLTIHLIGAEFGGFLASEKQKGILSNYAAPLNSLSEDVIKLLPNTISSLEKEQEMDPVFYWGKLHTLGLQYKIDEQKRSLNSLITVNVSSAEKENIGTLYFGHHETDFFNSEHGNLLLSIAAHLSLGVEKALLYEKVLDLNQKKDEFISLASHELKTPLTGINGYIQILMRLVREEQPGKYLGKTYQQVQKLTALVNDLLDVSKIEAGKLKFSTDQIDLVKVISDTIEMVVETNNSYQINFNTAFKECIIIADGQRMEQVLNNLLSNAIKYSPGTNRIEVLLEIVGNYALVGVKDFGMGIPQEKISNLFSRFYRIDEHTPNISGLGIGLYLSKEIISRHNGQIWVESEIGKGSIFWFKLPLGTNN